MLRFCFVPQGERVHSPKHTKVWFIILLAHAHVCWRVFNNNGFVLGLLLIMDDQQKLNATTCELEQITCIELAISNI